MPEPLTDYQVALSIAERLACAPPEGEDGGIDSETRDVARELLRDQLRSYMGAGIVEPPVEDESIDD